MDDGRPYWWRIRLDEIEAGICAKHLTPSKATVYLMRVLLTLQDGLDRLNEIPDSAIREDLRLHIEMGLKETFERAESLGVRLADAVRKLGSEDRLQR